MNIGLDAKRAFATPTGLGTYARTTIQALAQYHPEHCYVLLTPHLGSIPKAFPPGLHVHSPNRRGILGALWRSLWIPRAATRLHLHLYHGLSHELPLTPMPRAIRTLVTVHDLLFLSHPHRYPWVDRHTYRLKYSHSIRRAHRVLAISQATAQEVIARLGIPEDRVHVAYQACPEIYFGPPPIPAHEVMARLGLPQDFVLTVGSLIPRKQTATLIAALGLMPSSHRPPLVVVGTGPMEQSLRLQAQQHGVHALFLGHIPEALLPGLYHAACVLAYPSEAEGFGLPIVEALACGTPVVTSTGSCFAEAGGPGALYVPPGNAEALAHAICRILEDSSLAHSLRQAGTQHATRFHPRTVADTLLAHYRATVEDEA
jgi:glycosyltransferase involved in cell wall biosynthesis